MPEVNPLRNELESQYLSLGRAVISNVFPRDIEYYMCALELTTADGDTIDYFSFPIMPRNINKSENQKTSFYHGLNGTIILNTDSFTPSDLTISGDFGRSFKIVLGNIGKDIIKFRGVRYSNEEGVYDADDVGGNFLTKIPTLNASIKSGYGCVKILQSIINKAKGQEAGKSFRLYFYNPVLGESYLVVPTKNPLSLQQDESRNMIWTYTLNLTIIAPLDKVLDRAGLRKSLANSTSIDVIQKGVNSVSNKLIKYVG